MDEHERFIFIVILVFVAVLALLDRVDDLAQAVLALL